ncbi:MAG: hypothetical protein ACOCYV_01530 [Planctomycetota bacterium]
MTTDTITFRDRLARLSFRRAAKLLGPEGEHLIHLGGRHEFDNLDEVYLLVSDGTIEESMLQVAAQAQRA